MNRHGEILLGVGGGIAAYKACDLLRRLQDSGYGVTVVPTPASLNFVGAATWEALSGRPVTSSVFESVDQVRHVSLARETSAILIAPATADLISRIAAGRADDLLTNVILASSAPKVLIPAMHPAMWSNPATKANVSTLRDRGFFIAEPGEGALTSGDFGKGRLLDTADIIQFFQSVTYAQDLIGKKVLVSAGGTREPIDPVRYIGNLSSGRQGIAIAQAAALRGAEVTLILANAEKPDHPNIKTVIVKTASEMLTQLESHFSETDFLFMAAAIADARPAKVSEEKIKKDLYATIELVANPDLLATLTANKKNQIVCAFAAETANNSQENALKKLLHKRADFIYLNDVSNGAIFGQPTTSGHIIDISGEDEVIHEISKEKLAQILIDKALDKLG